MDCGQLSHHVDRKIFHCKNQTGPGHPVKVGENAKMFVEFLKKCPKLGFWEWLSWILRIILARIKQKLELAIFYLG